MVEIINERGLFWWDDTEVPNGHVAPDDHVAGTLTIDARGRVSIELDGILPDDNGPFAAVQEGSARQDTAIAGILKAANKHILALQVARNGGRIGGGINFERYVAQICLVSDKPIPTDPMVRAVDIDLTGFEEWLKLGRLTLKKTKRSLTVTRTNMPDIVYKSASGALKISSFLSYTMHGSFSSRGADLLEKITLTYRPRRSLTLPDAIVAFGYAGDLLVLLTGSEYQLSWPTVRLAGKQSCVVYFMRHENEAKVPSGHECLTHFPELKDHFGDLFFGYFAKRAALGPGFYQYLSTRRGQSLYEEHRFTSLVSGLEALHRSLFGGDLVSSAYLGKMTRILADIDNDADRKWLEARLKSLGAPNLAERLFDILSSLPAGLETKRLRIFCTSCAKILNDLFHHGHWRAAQGEDASIQNLNIRASALSYLYHARLLMEIGTPSAIVEKWLTRGVDAYRIAWFFEKAGLRSPKISA